MGERAHRARAGRHRRPNRLRPRLERPASGGGFLLPNEVVLKATFAAVKVGLTMKSSPSPAACGGVVQHRPRARGGELAPDGVEVELYDGLGLSRHTTRTTTRTARRPSPVARSPRAHRGGRRAARRHARVQRLDHRRAEERHRLGLRPPRGSWLWNKTVAVAGATTGQYGAIWAQQDLQRVLGIAGARVVDGELPVHAPTRSSTSRTARERSWPIDFASTWRLWCTRRTSPRRLTAPHENAEGPQLGGPSRRIPALD